MPVLLDSAAASSSEIVEESAIYVRLHCGSASTIRTRRPFSASRMARLNVEVVLDTPALWLYRGMIFKCFTGQICNCVERFCDSFCVGARMTKIQLALCRKIYRQCQQEHSFGGLDHHSGQCQVLRLVKGVAGPSKSRTLGSANSPSEKEDARRSCRDVVNHSPYAAAGMAGSEGSCKPLRAAAMTVPR